MVLISNSFGDYCCWFANERLAWRRYGAAFFAGALSVLALAPLNLWLVPFLTIPILVWLLDGADKSSTWRRFWSGAAIGWWFGFGYFLLGLYWIGGAFLVEAERFAWLLPFAVSLMPAALSLFFGLGTGLAHLIWQPGTSRVVALALSLSAFEWLRGHVLTGFPWNSIGYLISGSDVFMQFAAVVGLYGLGLIGLLAYALPALFFGDQRFMFASGQKRDMRLLYALLVWVVGTCIVLFGVWRIPPGETELVPDVSLRIVQPNIAQVDKWRVEKRAEIFDRFLRLSQTGADGRPSDLSSITHLIWPESAIPFLLLRSPDAQKNIADILPSGLVFMTGALRMDERLQQSGAKTRTFYNSFFVMDSDAQLLRVYDKIHLVPFGEYLPFQSLLEAAGFEQLTRVSGGFAFGASRAALEIPGAPRANSLICYEIVFPGAVSDPDNRPGWLINVTNDGWFGLSAGPYQHLHQARMRAVEEGLPIIRAANTGVSAIIDPYGRVVRELKLGAQGVIDGRLPLALPATFYAKYKDWGFAFIFALLVLIFFLLRHYEGSIELAGQGKNRGEIEPY